MKPVKTAVLVLLTIALVARPASAAEYSYGWFQGDRVHANQRGCQIIGRLLERWFAE